MKLKVFTPIGVEIKQFLFTKRLHKTFFTVVPNTIGFARQTNSLFIP